MSKSKKITLNIITVTLFSVLFWVCNDYPKHILETSRLFSLANILRFLYYILFFFVLSLIFTKNKTLFCKQLINPFEPVIKRFNILKISVLIAVQILIDVLKNVLSGALRPYTYVVNSICVLLMWIVIYLVLADKEKNIFKNKKVLIISLSLIIISFLAFLTFDIFSVNHYFDIFSKYEANSDFSSYELIRLNFLHEVRMVAFDIIIGIILAVSHTLVATEQEDEKGKKAQFVIRIAVLLFAILVVPYALKFLICPESQLLCLPLKSSNSIKYKLEGEFHDSTRTNAFIRVRKLYGQYFYAYVGYSEIADIQNDNKVIATVNFPGEEGYTSLKYEDGELKAKGEFSNYYVGDELVQIYRNTAICFKENGKPCVVKFSEINKCEENPLITEVCKQLINEGNIVAFEYSCEYLLKYDNNFIKKYINRYSRDIFTTKEEEFLEKTCYRSEYISNIARKFVAET